MFWLLLYLALLFCAGLRHFFKKPTKDEYFVYGRRAGAGLAASSILASCIGGSATLGMIGLAWQVGFPAIWWLGAGVLGLLPLGFFAARKIRETGASTMPEAIQTLLGASCARLIALLIVIANLAVIGAQLSALAIIISTLAALDNYSSLIIAAASLALYTGTGGQHAVMRSDVWQLGILVFSICLALFLFLLVPACRQAITTTPLQLVNSQFGMDRLCYYILAIGGSYLIGPMLFGRLLSAKSVDTARKAVFIAAFFLALIAILIALTGIALKGLPIGDPRPEDALPAGMRLALPIWAVAPISLGIFSAVISSADSCLLTAAAVCSNDLFQRDSIGAARWAMAGITLLSSAIAAGGKGILPLLLAANDIYASGVVAPVFIALCAGKQSSGAQKIFLSAMTCGGCLGLVTTFTGNPSYTLAGIGASIVLSLAGVAASGSLLFSNCQKRLK